MSDPGPCPACGAVHHAPSTPFVLGPDALERLGTFVAAARWHHVVVVADANTDEVCAAAIADQLASAGGRVTRVVFPERHGLLADAAAVARVAEACARGADAAVAVGSGTLNDITRAASARVGVPYVAVPTAASMDGYASGVAALQLGGVKVTVPAQAPVGIFADPAVVAAAPAEMARWGLGDLAGKACAGFDWRLGALVTGEPYCAAIAARMRAALRACVAATPRLLSGEPSAVGVLLHALVESGRAMALQGSSRPASGAEHHVSHLLDLLAYAGRRPHAPHGLQVGFATRYVSALQRAALAHLGEALVAVPGARVAGEDVYLPAHDSHLERVRAEKAAAFATYRRTWPPPVDAASPAVALEESVALFGPVNGALEEAGIPFAVPFIGVDAPLLRGVLRFANRMRNRFSVLDLLEAQGRLTGAIEALVESSGR